MTQPTDITQSGMYVSSTSNGWQHIRDLCPVCNARRLTGSNRYCSTVCRVEAYNFRKRLLTVKQFLTKLGFVLDYCNGVQLKTCLPFVYLHAYPERLRTFDFVYPQQLIKFLAAPEYWATMKNYMGEYVGSYLQWLHDRSEHYTTDQLSTFALMAVNGAYQQPELNFRCVSCGAVYVRSEVSHLDGVCLDCAGVDPF